MPLNPLRRAPTGKPVKKQPPKYSERIKEHSRSTSEPIPLAIENVGGLSVVAKCKINFNFESKLNGGRKELICWDLPRSLSNFQASSHLANYLEETSCDHYLHFLTEAESFKACAVSKRSAASKLNVKRDQNEGKIISKPKDEEFVSIPQIKTLPKKNLSVDVKNLLEKYKSNEISKTGSSFRSNLLTSAMENLDIKTKAEKPEKKQTSSENIRQSLKQSAINNAVAIFQKYLSRDLTKAIVLPDNMYKTVMENICSEDSNNTSCFDDVKKHVMDLLSHDHFPGYLASEHFSRHVLDVISGNLTLTDILQLEIGFFAFTQYLDEDGNGSLLQFWIAAQTFREQVIENNNGKQNEKDAVVLYERYFSLQSTQPLGLGDNLRRQIEADICSVDGIKYSCFDAAIKVTFVTLEKNHLPKFQQSRYFVKMLQQVVNDIKHKEKFKISSSDTIHENQCYKTIETTLPSSKCYSDTVVETKEGVSVHKPHCSKLTLGRMNELGQYVTDTQADEELIKHKSTKKLSTVVKTLVSNSTDKSEEEMAWEMAQMIVSDINQQINQNK